MTEPAIPSRSQSPWSFLRLLSCIRFDEVLVLQGAPLIGAILALGAFTTASIVKGVVLAVGSMCLVAHVYVLNDWSGIHGDLKDPNRATQTFANKGISRTQIGFLATGLLILSVVLIGSLGLAPLAIALAMVTVSALYSAPWFHMKGIPVAGSVLHFAGATLHFLLGYATFTAIDHRGIAVGSFFGLVFAAGHLSHEARGWDGDSLNGIRTNAVAFGKAQSLVASLVLFTAAYALLVTLAAYGVVPRVLIFAAALYPVHLYAFWQAVRAGLSFESLLRLQARYRLLYAVIGVALVATGLLGWT